ncbi:MAG: ATP-binding protein, partial [Pseudomonadota bacterium]
TIGREGDAIRGAVRDDAAPFDPLSRGPVDPEADLEKREIGGLGVHLVRSMTDHLEYQFNDGRNVLTFTINIEKEAP